MSYRFYFTLILFNFFSYNAMAQIGINTENPQALFHVDALGNNNKIDIPTDAQTLDDVAITVDGNIGIGTANPQKKLHIVTGGTAESPKLGLRIDDGTQKNGNLLISDSQGFVKWGSAPPPITKTATQPSSDVNILSNTSTYVYTGAYIDLPQGKWMVTINTLLRAALLPGSKMPFQDKVLVHGTFTEKKVDQGDSVTDFSPDIENDKKIAALCNKTGYTVMIGSLIINNTSEITKRYYYLVGGMNQVGLSEGNSTYQGVQGVANSENSIVALQINNGI